MNRTPAHRIFSSAIALVFVFAVVAFVTVPLFSKTLGTVNVALAQFAETPPGASTGISDTPPGAARPGRRADPGDEPTGVREIEDFKKAVNQSDKGDINLGGFINDSTVTHMGSWYCILVSCFQGVAEDEVASSGIIPGLGKAIGFMYENPPASSQQYVAYVLKSAGVNIAQPAYAQFGGLGFSSLLPILDTWVRMRNLAYLFFVILFVVIGFMIMFRQKLGGQTVVTVQQAIPQIIISLLAVTFSFAIAGLLIDLMYLSMYLLLALFENTNSGRYMSGNLFVLGGNLMTQGVSTLNGSIIELVHSVFGQNFLTDIFAGTVGLGGSLVFAIAIAIRLFTLFFLLLKTYIGIILSIVTAPIALMLGAIPGKNNFSAWIKGLIGNLAAFPTVLFVLLLFESLTENINRGQTGGFVPPYLGGNGSAAAVSNMIGIGMILIIPTIVEEVKKALGAGDGVFGPYGKALSESVGAGWKRYGGAGAKAIGTGAAMGVGAAAGGVGGAIIGGGNKAIRGKYGEILQGVKKGAGRGALYGAVTPPLARLAPGLIKSTYNLTKEEVTQLAQRKILESAYSGMGNNQNIVVKTGKNIIGSQLQRLRQNMYGPQYNPNQPFTLPVTPTAGANNAAATNTGQTTNTQPQQPQAYVPPKVGARSF